MAHEGIGFVQLHGVGAFILGRRRGKSEIRVSPAGVKDRIQLIDIKPGDGELCSQVKISLGNQNVRMSQEDLQDGNIPSGHDEGSREGMPEDMRMQPFQALIPFQLPEKLLYRVHRDLIFKIIAVKNGYMIENTNTGNNGYHILISIIIILFASLVYDEIVIINKWGLNKNVKLGIIYRGVLDTKDTFRERELEDNPLVDNDSNEDLSEDNNN